MIKLASRDKNDVPMWSGSNHFMIEVGSKHKTTMNMLSEMEVHFECTSQNRLKLLIEDASQDPEIPNLLDNQVEVGDFRVDIFTEINFESMRFKRVLIRSEIELRSEDGQK